MEFGVLGEVTADVAGEPVVLGPARQRLVLAILLVDANRVVSVDDLVRRVWGDDPPQRARGTLQSYVSRLRRAVGSARLLARSGGYVLVAERTAVDVQRFRDLGDQARAATTDAQAVTLLTEALGLWRGEALAGLEGTWASAERDRLHQQRLLAQHDLADARLRLGHGEDLVDELSARLTEHPLDERVAGQYLLALYRAGRAADALELYRRMRTRLAEELGTDPGPALQELHQRILRADPSLLGTARRAAMPESVPRQLPTPPAQFAGRGSELAELTAQLDQAGDAPTVVISALAGAGGIGKTWLALHWAHAHADRFPDGQLFADLRGFSPDSDPLDPLTAVRGFLDALGVDATRVSGGLDEHAACYRSTIADKRMLIVLDNAATADQVIPLLPGTPTCTVLVTSRKTLTTLLHRYGARHLSLSTLDEDEAHELLTDRLGDKRLDAEPDAVADLIRSCGRYPLALAITAGRAHARPGIPLAEFAAELREFGLDALDDDVPAASLPAVLSWSLRALTTEQRTAFALLGIAPGADIGLPAAAGLTAASKPRMAKVLRELEDASLLGRRANGRYSMHDLIRAYASATAHDTLAEDTRSAALRRVVDHYLHTAHAADRLLDPHRTFVPLDALAPGATPEPPADATAALTWFDTEHPNLLAAQRCAADHRWHQLVWHLAWAMETFHSRRRHRQDRVAVWELALDAATHLPDPTSQITAHRLLGRAHGDLGRRDEAIAHLSAALDLAERCHDPAQQAHTHQALAAAWEAHGGDQQALHHATQALSLYRTLDQPTWEGRALNNVGWYAARLGDLNSARAHCHDALALFRRCHNPDGEASALDSLGYINHHAGNHHQAVEDYEQALALRRHLGHTTRVADTLDKLGDAHTVLGHHDRARTAWREALELYESQHRAANADRVRQQLDSGSVTTRR
ncbi:BTAD domain-containing putative transcriptional regulator [Kutzneria buriramensis]|uniref:DNA-binding SARP family transcriptional activator n=1 Tax=Kutzneria buriramensis TaxID=1045776 RepID=A0A3E0HI59_9PSEU|nr:BTAD domain-containing putative transcriptional regulator [Kutzneria buriramensis]REH46072.1 DNA-binding SARP family transcriptional activator [Kutzneria buriramensis]